jgi:hypothetical protein
VPCHGDDSRPRKKIGARFRSFQKYGVYIAPALCEAGFASAAHGEENIAAATEAAREIFRTPSTMNALRLLPALSAFLLFPGLALAQSFEPKNIWINPGFYSAHFDSGKGLENVNQGLGFEYPLSDTYRITAGTFHNSDRKQSNYVGLYVLPFEFYGVKFGAVVGGFDGYPNYRNGNWFPAIIPTAAIEGKNWGLNIAYVPTIKNRLYGALTFQLKYRFGTHE